MNGFIAAIRKDLILFFRKGGVFSLLFPLLLFPFFLFFFRGTSGSFRSFPVSVVDEDETIMSKTLIRQMEDVELFSEVHRIRREEIDRELQEGSVGVLCIPKDFFYTAYRFQGEPVELILNEKRPTESAILESVFTSIMKIMEKEQEVSLSVYHTAYGDKLSEKEEEALYESASERLLSAVLRRQLVFQDTNIESNVATALLIRISSALLFLFLSFTALSMVAAVPEEAEKGIVSRFRQMGGRGFYLSKWLVLLFLSLPMLLFAELSLKKVLALSGEGMLVFLFYFLLSLFSFFLFFLGLFRVVRDARLGKNLSLTLLFLTLLFTGRLFSSGKIPFSLARFSPISITAVLLEGLRRGYPFSAFLPFFYPLFLLSLFSLLLFFCRTKGTGKARTAGLMMRVLPFPLWRGYIRMGRVAGCLLLLFFCLFLGKYAEDRQEAHLAVYLVEKDRGDWSKELIKDLETEKSLSLYPVQEKEAEEKLLYGDKEGVLTIEEGYTGDEEGRGKLLYETSSSSLSEMAVREIVAAYVARERTMRTEKAYLSSLLGRKPTEKEEKVLMENNRKYRRTTPLFTIERKNGAEEKTLFMPKKEAVYAFLLYFYLFSFSAFYGESEEKKVEGRLRSLSGGTLRLFMSDALLYLLLSIAFALALKLRFSLFTTLSLVLYAFFLFAFSKGLSSKVLGEGAETGLGLHLGLLFSLLGGAFMDFSALGEKTRLLPYLSPVGLFLKGTEGDLPALALLVLLDLILFLLPLSRFPRGRIKEGSHRP